MMIMVLVCKCAKWNRFFFSLAKSIQLDDDNFHQNCMTFTYLFAGNFFKKKNDKIFLLFFWKHFSVYPQKKEAFFQFD